MILRSLGLRTQELEAGPYHILLSDSIPVAYTDGSGWYRTLQYFNKGTTKRLNKWLKDRTPVALVEQSAIIQVFESISRFTEVAEERRQSGRREADQTPASVLRLAEALSDVLVNGRS